MPVTKAVIGVDVGGTNTDAVIVDKSAEKLTIISQAKTSTTGDVTTGVSIAIHLALIASRKENRTLAIHQVNIGTTHFINAVVEGKRLAKVAVIRLCGTASIKLPPFSDFGKHLVKTVRGKVFMVNGGYQFDGSEIAAVNEEELVSCIEELKRAGDKNIVVSGIFSPVRQEQEKEAVEIIRRVFPDASVTASHEIGRVGLLERENAAILNECIKPLCLETIKGFRSALDDLGLKCPLYLTQNDGTILNEDTAVRFPVCSFASGATNSMRGAAFLSGLEEAMIVDIGGTSTDVGILLKGFPREASTEVKVCGIRTNFRMPDVISIGLGGGSYVNQRAVVNGKEQLKVGPQSAGYRLATEALVFDDTGNATDRCLTTTDIAVAAGLANIGNKENVGHLAKDFVKEAVDKIHEMLASCVDQMRFNDRDLPLVLVGGGSIIVDQSLKFDGVSEIIIPNNYDVANAVGAALSQVSATADTVVDLEKYIDKNALDKKLNEEFESKGGEISDDERRQLTESVRKTFLKKSREIAIDDILQSVKAEAVANGAIPETLSLVDKEDVSLAYIPGNATRIKVKVVGNLNIDETATGAFVVPESVYVKEPVTGHQLQKQIVSTTGVILTDTDDAVGVMTPNIDENTGEWLLSSYDIECLSIGAGILGCGGGGNPHIGKLLALQALEMGQKIRVLTPSSFLKHVDPENDLMAGVAFMGAPLVVYEKLVAGNETIGALQCIQDLYGVGDYDAETCELKNNVGIDIQRGEGITYIDDYKGHSKNSGDTLGKKKIVALVGDEIGGMNCIEPLLVGAEMDLPILDCDGMGRAFPELQMCAPFIYGHVPYPSSLVDDKGRRAVVLNVDGPKHLENHFRDVVIQMGCSGGTVLSHFKKEEVLKTFVQHSLSRAWRIGDTVLRARTEHQSPVDAIVQSQHGKFLVYGKITDVLSETTGGFNKGKIKIDGLDAFDGKTFTIEFQNEFLVCRDVTGDDNRVIVCVPDLITLMDADTAQPIPTEELRFGIRVAGVGLRVDPLMSTEQALKYVGPQAFGYGDDVKYVPLGHFVPTVPIAPV